MPLDMRVRRRGPLIMMLAGVLVLGGCAAEPAAPAPADDTGSTGANTDSTDTGSSDGDSSTDGDSSPGSGATLPDDFPSDIPLPQAELAEAVRHELDSGAHWVLQYEGEITEEEFTALSEQLIERGFAEQTSTSAPGQLIMARHANDQYTVDISLKWQKVGQLLQMAVSAGGDS